MLIGETVGAVDQSGNQVLLFIDAGTLHRSLKRVVRVVIKVRDNAA